MKKFTVKDFLSYNNPCFSCKENVNFYFITTNKATIKDNAPSGIISPIVTVDYTSIDLRKTYNHALTMNIAHKSNKFSANNKHELKDFLQTHFISLLLSCPKCQSAIESSILEFNWAGGFIKPTQSIFETLNVYDKKRTINLDSRLDDNNPQTVLMVTNAKSSNSFRVILPPLPLSKFKNKATLLDKVKTYLIFS